MVYGSELVRLEVRVKAIRENRQDYLKRYEAYFDHCRLVSFDRALFDLATQLRVDHRLKTPDSLHLAAALLAHCDEFWTNDQRLVAAASRQLNVVDWQMLGLDPSR